MKKDKQPTSLSHKNMAGANQQSKNNKQPVKQPAVKNQTKTERILEAFVRGEQLHRFNTFTYRETCLHSTVSLLQNKYGVQFARKTIRVNRQGDMVNVTLYWLPYSSFEQAHEVLTEMRERRGVNG